MLAESGLDPGAVFCAFGMAEVTIAGTFPLPGEGMIVDSIDRLRQAVDNLLDNARVHTPASSRVRVTLGSDADSADVLLSVADEGPGLTSDVATRAFERRFELADFVRVEHADLADGLLVIDLVREVPEAMKPKKIMVGGQPSLEVVKDGSDEPRGDQANAA